MVEISKSDEAAPVYGHLGAGEQIVKPVTLRAIFLASMALGLLPQPVHAAPSAARIIELTNEARVTSGLAPLSVNAQLASSALGKSSDMLAKNYFAHTSPEGWGLAHWLKIAGYNYVAAGENLAKDAFVAEVAFKAWMASPLHRANILSDKFTETGVGIVHSGTATFITQHFGSRAAPSVMPAAPQKKYPAKTAAAAPSKMRAAARAAAAPHTAPPTIGQVELGAPAIGRGETLTITAEVSGNPRKVTVRAGSKEAALSLIDGKWRGEVVLYAGGVYAVVLEAKDEMGNKAKKEAGTVTVNLPPLIDKQEPTWSMAAEYVKENIWAALMLLAAGLLLAGALFWGRQFTRYLPAASSIPIDMVASQE